MSLLDHFIESVLENLENFLIVRVIVFKKSELKISGAMLNIS